LAAIQDVAEMTLTGFAEVASLSDARALAQGKGTGRDRPKVFDGISEPTSDIFRGLVAFHVCAYYIAHTVSLQAKTLKAQVPKRKMTARWGPGGR
jgi:hypothetical protein